MRLKIGKNRILLHIIISTADCSVPFNVFEDVALIIPCSDLEGQCCVVALKHGCVIVEDGQLTSGIAEEAVGAAWVVHVVHSRSDQGGYLINGVQTLLLKRTK